MIMIKGLKMMKMAPRTEGAGKQKRRKESKRGEEEERERERARERKRQGEKEQPWQLDHRFKHLREGSHLLYINFRVFFCLRPMNVGTVRPMSYHNTNRDFCLTHSVSNLIEDDLSCLASDSVSCQDE